MAVLDPITLIIDNYPDDKIEYVSNDNNPEDPNSGAHEQPFAKELLIEREDFKEDAGNKFFRLTLGKEVRLKNAYIIKGESVVKDAQGNLTAIHCSYDPESLSGSGTEASKRRVKGTLHWVSKSHAFTADVRSYDRLFMDESPDTHKDKDFMEFVNPNSLEVLTAYCEPFLKEAKAGDRFQFQRLGYFCVDPDSTADRLIFNKTVGLRDTWAKQKPAQPQAQKANNNAPRQERPAIEQIKQLGKKYTNLPEEKQALAKAKILELAAAVPFDEVSALFGTAAKKVGTRLAVVFMVKAKKELGEILSPDTLQFLQTAAQDKHPLLAQEAQAIIAS